MAKVSGQKSAMQVKSGEAGGYKSSPGGSDGNFSGIRDTSEGSVPQLKRNNPSVGVYQSGNNNRGGSFTSNYDRSLDTDCSYEAPGLAALRAKQDGRRGQGGGPKD